MKKDLSYQGDFLKQKTGQNNIFDSVKE